MTIWSVMGSSNSENLAKKIAKNLKARYIKTNLRIFPDGESKITTAGKFEKGTVVVVSSMGPPVDSNLFRTLLLISKAREMSSDVIAVIPYMAYAKQDKEFLEGEIVSIKVLARLLKKAGAIKLIMVDFHSKDALKFFKISTKNISALNLIANHLARYNLKNPLVVAPDLFWKEQAQKLGTYLNGKSIALNKYRNRKTGELILKKPYPKFQKGGDLIIFDDMVSTGGSVVQALQFFKKKSFRNIFVICTHPVLVNDAEKKLKKYGVSTIIGTNSINGKFSKIDLSEVISKTIKNWN